VLKCTLYSLTTLAALLAPGFSAQAMVPRKAPAGSPPAKAAAAQAPAKASSSRSLASSSSTSSTSSSSPIPQAPETPTPWGVMKTVESMPGYGSKVTWNLGRSSAPGERFSLTVPRALENRVLVGTRPEDSGAPARLLCLRGTPGPLEGLTLGQLDLGTAGTPDHPVVVESVHWIHPELALAAHGGGRLTLVSVGESGSLSFCGELPRKVQEASVHEIAGNAVNPQRFAVGGFSKHLALVDLEQPETTQLLPAEETVTSVRWPAFNQGVCPSVTLGKGTLLIYDARINPLATTAYRAQFAKDELFAHERVSDDLVLVGFSDGQVRCIDLRKTNRPAYAFQDPFVLAIGNLEFDAQQNRLLVSGIPDLSVHDYDPGKGILKVRCHYHPGKKFHAGKEEHTGTFIQGDSVFSTSSGGCVSLIGLGLPESGGAWERKEDPVASPSSTSSSSSSATLP